MLKSHKSMMAVIYIYNHENNVPSRLSPQRLYGNSCTWEHDVRLQIAGINELKCVQQAKLGALYILRSLVIFFKKKVL